MRNHEDQEFEAVRRHLQSVLPPCRDEELKTDLWPRMTRRMAEAPLRFGWFERALAGLVAVSAVLYPELVTMLLFHL